MSNHDVEIHFPRVGRPSDYWCLLADHVADEHDHPIGVVREGEHEFIHAQIVIIHRRGLYSFTSREARDKFVRRANSLSDLESEVAFPVSFQLAEDYKVRTQVKP